MMHTYTDLLNLFNGALSREDFSGKPAELYEPVTYTLSLGGKRMRPILLLMSCEMFGGDLQKAINQAIGIEVFHNFTLIHDDIMDKAPLRRGKETVYKRWNENIAILSGDTMFALAYQYIAQTEGANIRDILAVFTRTAIEVCEGQQLDMNFETSGKVNIGEYLDMIRLKTAVLLGAALKIGAMTAGAGLKECEDIYNFGVNLGLAFQLKDDLLDVFGDTEKFGKITGGDIIAKKKTFLYLKAYEIAGRQQKESLDKLFSLPEDQNNEKVQGVKQLYQDMKIPEATETMIFRLYNLAVHHFQNIGAPPERKALLQEFADQIIKRDY